MSIRELIAELLTYKNIDEEIEIKIGDTTLSIDSLEEKEYGNYIVVS